MRLEVWQRTLAAAIDGKCPVRGPWPASRVEVHRRNVLGARVAALACHYPLTKRALGKEFERLAHAFAGGAQGERHDLNSYGGTFATWIGRAQRRRIPLRRAPYLVDLARLERAMQEAYYAPDSTSHFPSVNVLLREASRLRLLPAPSLQLLTVRFAVDELLTASAPHEATPVLERLRPARHLAVWRHRMVPTCVSLDPDTSSLLGWIARGKSLASLARLGAPAAMLQPCIEWGWVVGCVRIRSCRR